MLKRFHAALPRLTERSVKEEGRSTNNYLFEGTTDALAEALDKSWSGAIPHTLLIAPGGEIIAGPMRNEQGILYAEIDSHRTGIAKRALDITGHYARPDIFQLHVNTQPQNPVKFD